MSSRLYVGNLEWKITDKELELLFGSFGKVLFANVIIDRQTGRSRGFGFVEMENQRDARQAVEELNGKAVWGRNLVVREAKPEGANPEGDGSFFKRINDFINQSEPGEKFEFNLNNRKFYIVREES